MSRIVYGITFILITVGVWAWSSSNIPEPVVIEKTIETYIYEEVIKEVPVIVEIIREIEVTVEVEKIVKQYTEPTTFDNQTAIQEWFDRRTIFALTPDICQIVAQDLFLQALEEGYIIYPVPVYQGKVWGIKVTNITGYHMGIIVPAGRYWYYIEIAPSEYQWQVRQIKDDKVVIVR